MTTSKNPRSADRVLENYECKRKSQNGDRKSQNGEQKSQNGDRKSQNGDCIDAKVGEQTTRFPTPRPRNLLKDKRNCRFTGNSSVIRGDSHGFRSVQNQKKVSPKCLSFNINHLNRL